MCGAVWRAKIKKPRASEAFLFFYKYYFLLAGLRFGAAFLTTFLAGFLLGAAFLAGFRLGAAFFFTGMEEGG